MARLFPYAAKLAMTSPLPLQPQSGWLLYCRAGFEPDCAEEALREAERLGFPLTATHAVPDSGFVVLTYKGQARLPMPDWRSFIFARQALMLIAGTTSLTGSDRITPLLDALAAPRPPFSDVWVEMPDTNAGKELSAFARRVTPLLSDALINVGRLRLGLETARLHVFFADKYTVWLASGDTRCTMPEPMGITRLRMPAEAPSRSTLKLAEAFEQFLTPDEQQKWLHDGGRAVDLGAAPGGWTWQLLRRGLRVMAVDNGALKGLVAEHPWVTHLKTDGLRFRPDRPVDWVVCDMVEKPSRVASLMARWLVDGDARLAIFNLKLPMKKRLQAVEAALQDIHTIFTEADARYRLAVKQLYHDREEVTVFLVRESVRTQRGQRAAAPSVEEAAPQPRRTGKPRQRNPQAANTGEGRKRINQGRSNQGRKPGAAPGSQRKKGRG